MKTAKLLDRVQKLIMLASSPAEAEATSAALLACRLIRESGLVAVARADLDESAAYLAELEAYVATVERRLKDAHAQIADLQSKQLTPPIKPSSRLKSHAQFVSTYQGICKSCGQAYYVGDKVFWRRDVGCWHEGCEAP